MNKKNIEDFLKRINCTDPGMGLDDFTDKVIANLSPAESYEFRVTYAVEKYTPTLVDSGKSQDTEYRKKFLEERRKFIQNQLPIFKDILSKQNISYSEEFILSPLGISIYVNINGEQARQLKSDKNIKYIYAYNPFTPQPQNMSLDKSMLPES